MWTNKPTLIWTEEKGEEKCDAAPHIPIPVSPVRWGAALQVEVECVMVRVCISVLSCLLWLHFSFYWFSSGASTCRLQSPQKCPCPGLCSLTSSVPHKCPCLGKVSLWHGGPPSNSLHPPLQQCPQQHASNHTSPSGSPCVFSPLKCVSLLNTCELWHESCDFRG